MKNVVGKTFFTLAEIVVSLLTAKKQKTIEERYTKPCTYWDYILPGELIKLQRGREGEHSNKSNHIICCRFNFELSTKDLFCRKGIESS
jgi:hypothetical protein